MPTDLVFDDLVSLDGALYFDDLNAAPQSGETDAPQRAGLLVNPGSLMN